MDCSRVVRLAFRAVAATLAWTSDWNLAAKSSSCGEVCLLTGAEKYGSVNMTCSVSLQISPFWNLASCSLHYAMHLFAMLRKTCLEQCRNTTLPQMQGLMEPWTCMWSCHTITRMPG